MKCINELKIYKIGGEEENEKKLIVQANQKIRETFDGVIIMPAFIEIIFPGFDPIEVSAKELKKAIENCTNSA